MDASLPAALEAAEIPRPIMGVLTQLRARGFEAFLVGGCVRDLLRGEPPKDFDVATAARPEQVQAAFSKVIPTGIDHGTVTVLAGGGTHVEVTTFRSEGAYVDGRRPSSVAFETDIVKDLSRRDFTMNAMAFDPVGRTLVDPYGGREDLKNGLIRCVGDALERFSEDGLRPYRAVRFAAVLGFTLEPSTRAAIPQVHAISAKVAWERVREELQKLLLSRRPALGLSLLRETELLSLVSAELHALEDAEWNVRQGAVERSPAALELRFAALLSGLPCTRDILERLKPPARLLDDVVTLAAAARAQQERLATDDVALRRLAAQLGPALAKGALTVAAAWCEARGDEKAAKETRSALGRLASLLDENPPLTAKALALTGKDVMRILAVPPSPRVGEATRYLLERVLEEPGRNTAPQLTQLLLEWHAQTPG